MNVEIIYKYIYIYMFLLRVKSCFPLEGKGPLSGPKGPPSQKGPFGPGKPENNLPKERRI
jgi:hypothetical protein